MNKKITKNFEPSPMSHFSFIHLLYMYTFLFSKRFVLKLYVYV